MKKNQFKLFIINTSPNFDKQYLWEGDLPQADFVLKTFHFNTCFSEYRQSALGISYNKEGFSFFGDKKILTMGESWSFPNFVVSALHFKLQNDFKTLNEIYVSPFRWCDIAKLIVSPSVGEAVLNFILQKKYNLSFFDQAKQGVKLFVKMSPIIAPCNSPGFFFTSKLQLERLLYLFSKDSYKIQQIAGTSLQSKDLRAFLNFLSSCTSSSFKN